MSDESDWDRDAGARAPEDAEAPQGSVLGNLPRERPGRRSPRRSPKAAAGPRDAERPDAMPEYEHGAEEAGGGLDDLAWAGIAVAAEAATLGVRLVNRVIETGTGRQERPR